MSVGEYFFSKFIDHGWLCSKILSIAIYGYLCWLFPALHIVKFTNQYTWILTVLLLLSMGGLQLRKRTRIKCPWKIILCEELLFLAIFLLWTYVSGFHPELQGTEKPMDYGFMASINRSDYFPPADIWYGGENINYYYGGQYFAVYLSRLACVPIAKGYHLMKAFLAAIGFVIPFSLCFQLLQDKGCQKRVSVIGGLLSGMAICFCGNMHYIIFGLFRKIFGIDGTYWFSNSTRFIGYVPETMDKTIHEFPAYSFLLGDLHAHVINILFVLLCLSLIYAWIQEDQTEKKSWIKYPIMIGYLLGLFMMINTWDWLIYLTIGCGTCLLWVITKSYEIREKIKMCILGWGLLLSCSLLISAPFLYQFNGSSAALGVTFTENHSKLWQLLVLWGVPITFCILFFIWCLNKYRRKSKIPSNPDLYIILLSICGIGLILIPELVYVRDIYENGYARANTMFKLTYQASILFGITIGYILLTLCQEGKALKAVSVFGICTLILTSGYFITGAKDYYKIFDSKYQTLDGTAYLEHETLDSECINWINDHIEGQPILLTADGDSYSDFCYVSAMTGIPTVLGWHTHEWLWRGRYEDVMKRSEDIKTIYTSNDQNQIQALLEKYHVEYILIGEQEREAYPELNIDRLASIGKIVYEDKAIIIKCE